MSEFTENRVSDSGISMDDNNDRNSLDSHTSSSSFSYNYFLRSSSNTTTEPTANRAKPLQRTCCKNKKCECSNDVPSVGKKLSYVQKMAARFETICQKQQDTENENHHKCNWWLSEENSLNSSKSATDSSLANTNTSTSNTTTTNEESGENIDEICTDEHVIEHENDDNDATDVEEFVETTEIYDNNGSGDKDEESDSEQQCENKQLVNDNTDKITSWNIESEFGECKNDDDFGAIKSPIETANIKLIAHKPLLENNSFKRPVSYQKSVKIHQRDDDVDSTYSDSFGDSGSDGDSEDNSTEVVYEVEAEAAAARPDSLVSQSSNKLTNIVRELIENEENYVRTLQKGIENYVSSLDVPNLPLKLRGQKRFIFGNIDRIYDLHANMFCPALRACEEDVMKIAETFINYVQKDYFYCYILFVLNRPKSEKICRENIEFFQERQNIVGDKLGINSFLLQPIQRLPRYQLLLNEIIKELGKNMERDDVKPLIAAICRAEKCMQRLLDTVNESMSINDITEVYEVNLLAQGKFRKMGEFDMFDHTLKRRYYGKVFLFEKCIIYTELISSELLEYRGHYERDLFGLSAYDGKNKFNLFSERLGVQEVEFFAEINRLEDWYKTLHGMLKDVIEEEKKKVSGRKTSNPGTRVSKTNSVYSTRSSVRSWFSNTDSLSSGGSGGPRDSVSSVDSYELGKSKWNANIIIDKLKYTEKHYIILLISNRKHYLSEVPEEVVAEMGDFLKLFHTILNFHHYQFYPELKKNGIDMMGIANIFKLAIQQNAFDVYYKYAALCGRVETVLQTYYRGNYKECETLHLFQPLDGFISLPLSQITKYRKIFDILIEKLRDREIFTMNSGTPSTSMADETIELFQAAAFVQVEMEKIEKIVQENNKLYTIKKNRIPDMDKCVGLVLSSELVSTDGLEKFNHRLFLTEKSLVCVKIKIQNAIEHYTDVVYAISYAKLDVRKSQSHKRCLKLYSKSMKQKKFIVHFMNNHKMNIFADRLVKYME